MTTEPKTNPTHCPKCQILLTVVEGPFAIAAKCEKCNKVIWVGQRTAWDSMVALAAKQGFQLEEEHPIVISLLCMIIDTRDQMLREEIRRLGMQVGQLRMLTGFRKGG